jgi:putative ABC transport system permease protein
MDGGEPEEIQVSRIRPTLLDMVGVRPRAGRPLVEADTASGAAPVALISQSLWRQRFGADAAAVGQQITLGDTPHTIVGVMPERFVLPQGSDAVWVADRGVPDPKRSESALGKLQRGVTVVEAQRTLDGLATDADDDLKGWSGQLMSPADYHGSQIRVALYVLAGAVGLLLLIACANVASLVLSRNSARRRELAVRLAIGASRGQLVRHLFAESLLVAAAGGTVGLLIGRWCLSLMTALRPHNLDVLERVHLDGSALAFAAAVSGAAALLFGIAPAVAASRVNLHEILKTGGWSLTGSGLGARKLLAIAQIAIALVLGVGAGLLLRSYAKLSAVDPGFDPSGVLSVRISLPADRYPVKDKDGRHAFFEEVLSQVRALPGVGSAAVGTGVPPEMGIMFGTLAIEGQSSTGQSSIFTGGYVTPEYFSTLRIPLVEGRPFSGDDRLGRERVVIVGRGLAGRHWPGESPLGARLRLASTGEWATVVGVAADVKGSSLASAVQHPQLYFPRAQIQPGFGAIVVRATGDPRSLIPAIKTVIWAIDPKLPLTSIMTADQLLARATSQARFSLALLTAFALCGLALVTVGVYGVMALFVGQRQRELGIRVALGASRSAVARLVLRQAGVVLVAGLAAGTAGAALLAGYLQSLLFQIPPRDAVSFVSAAAAIAVAAIAATLVPLVRATGTDPAAVLRGD